MMSILLQQYRYSVQIQILYNQVHRSGGGKNSSHNIYILSYHLTSIKIPDSVTDIGNGFLISI
jgi:hypothetical protein